MAHKKQRTVHLGEHVTLLFEDELTIRYQIQEMLRIEKIFDEAGIQRRARRLQSAGARRPQLEGDDADRVRGCRRTQARAGEAERHRGSRLGAGRRLSARVYAIADEDLERENDEKTSAVHFVRFELAPEMIAALKAGLAFCDRRRSPGIHGRRFRRCPNRPEARCSRISRSAVAPAVASRDAPAMLSRGSCRTGRESR